MAKKYIVRLTEEERTMLTALLGKGQASAQKIKHANVLLKVDADGPNWSDELAAEAFECAPRTVRHYVASAHDPGGRRRENFALRSIFQRGRRSWRNPL